MKRMAMNLLVSLLMVNSVISIQRDRKIACYFLVDDGPTSVIDPNLCTHVLTYGLLRINWITNRMVFHNYQKNAKVMDQLKSLKSQNPDLKIVGSVGCSGTDCPLRKIVVNPQLRTDFINSAINVVNEHNFDGLDFDWEYPACPNHRCQQNSPEKAGFSSLLKELKSNLGNVKTLSAAVHPISWISDKAYDSETISSLDFLNVMDYDAAGGWDRKTGHHANFQWAQRSMNYWASRAPKSKLLMGLPFYGVKFELKDPNQNGLNAPIIGDKSTQITYRQICQLSLFNGWKTKRTDVGPIAYSGNQWISYDDPIATKEKAKWIRQNGFGGVMIWETNQDDIDGKCSNTKRPMLNAAFNGLFA